ncbi:hypothetical protein ACFV4K_24550 [Nocardia sp. NPDC059764]|uniref:hypothetical protein n=1 Tax=Nocardia sp. NPDC059764 TaxID=3346939 RepID=UPI003660EB94
MFSDLILSFRHLNAAISDAYSVTVVPDADRSGDAITGTAVMTVGRTAGGAGDRDSGAVPPPLWRNHFGHLTCSGDAYVR